MSFKLVFALGCFFLSSMAFAQEAEDARRTTSVVDEDFEQVIHVTFAQPIRFSGIPLRRVEMIFSEPIQFSGIIENDLSVLEGMVAEISAVDEMLERWVSHGHLAQDLVGQSSNSERYRNDGFPEWLASSLRATFYTLNAEIELQERNQRHLVALQAAIDDLRFEADQDRLRESISYFESSIGAWRDRYAEIRSRYYQCLLDQMFEAWRLDMEARRIWRAPDYTREAYQTAYQAMEAALSEAYACTSRSTLDPLTRDPVFDWPIAE